MLVIATCARGGGDSSFARRLLESLHASSAPGSSCSLAIVAQSGVEPAAAARAILLPRPAFAVSGWLRSVRLLIRGAGDDAAAVSPWVLPAEACALASGGERLALLACGAPGESSLTTGGSLVAPSAARIDGEIGATAAAAIGLVVQGPLSCFRSGRAALAACFAGGAAPEASADAHAPPPMLTIREFGMGAFAAATPMAPLYRDVSAGLCAADGELGIFALEAPVAALCCARGAAAAAPLIFLGYYRTERHARVAGRMAASAALLQRAPSGGSANFLVLLPSVKGASMAAFEAGLRDIFSAAVALDVRAAGGDASSCGDESLRLVFPCSSGAREGFSDCSGADADALVVPVTVCADMTAAHAGARIADFHVADLTALRLDRERFVQLLAGASGAIVTGDASLNEALCVGAPLWYSCEPHKRAVDSALREAVRQRAERAGAPAAPAACAQTSAAAAIVEASWRLWGGDPDPRCATEASAERAGCEDCGAAAPESGGAWAGSSSAPRSDGTLVFRCGARRSADALVLAAAQFARVAAARGAEESAGAGAAASGIASAALVAVSRTSPWRAVRQAFRLVSAHVCVEHAHLGRRIADLSRSISLRH